MALFTSTSMWPHDASTDSTAGANEARSKRSSVIGKTRRPAASIADAVDSRLPGRPPAPVPSTTVRAVMATSYPSAARAQAIARPMPRLAPVTIATRAGLPSFVRDLGMTVDVRTRVDGTVPPVDPTLFFESVLPQAVTDAAELLAPAVAHLAPPPLTVALDRSTWAMAPVRRRRLIE